MNRIDQKFVQLKRQGKKAFIAFITAGDPNLKITEALVPALEKAGVDIVELGIPFSDPLADGTTIQAASARSLSNGTTVEKIFASAKRIRQHTQIPIALMTYYNVVFRYGEEKFIKACHAIGIDGLIIPDLPPEEATVLRAAAARYGIAVVFFIAPTTTNERIKANAKASTGFIYHVALTGVTGTQEAQAQSVIKDIKRAKKFTTKPICAGFGISTPQQIKAIAPYADGIIVGSAIIKKIQEYKGKSSLVADVVKYVHSLVKVCKK